MTGKVLLTGGAGFIGSHCYVALVEAGFDPVILDNFQNARRDLPGRLEQITGRPTPVIEADIRDSIAVQKAMDGGRFDAVVHFAALKSVPGSEADPVGYYDVNVGGLVNVVRAMQAHGVSRMVFSSSAAVYGEAEVMPVTEDSPVRPQNVYARTKLVGEDWPTPDGPAIRDYLPVEDLAEGHVLSLERLMRSGADGGHLVNLGTGQGHTVREVLDCYGRVSGQPIRAEIAPRRAGDAAISYADTGRAEALLGFRATRDLAQMCASNWDFMRAKA
ncbi:MAG: NAD-dependent epimerase/dehydratase family protein [Paracoccus sp. (in: a-proteobacteria)]